MNGAYVDASVVVGIDLHRKRTVIVHKDRADGTVLDQARIANDPERLVAEAAKAGPGAPVVLEATYGWYWAVDALREAGFEVHLAHPSGCASFRNRRVKNDFNDAGELADLLRMNRLPEGWIAPPEVRELREMVRHRHRLVDRRTALKNQIHAVLAKCGVPVTASDLFGPSALRWLEGLQLPAVYADRIASLRRLIDHIDAEVDLYDSQIAARLRHDPAYAAVQTIPGVGPVLGAVFVAEIGDIIRFGRPAQLCCWAGLTPRHYESDTTVRRGRISKQGSRLVRWAAVEAVQRQRAANPVTRTRERVAANRCRNIGKVAAARELLTHVFYAMRDHQVRALAKAAG